MSVSISQGGDGPIITDILAGGRGFETRMRRFEEAQAHYDRAHQLRLDAEAIKSEAEKILEKARATNDAADLRFFEASQLYIKEYWKAEAIFNSWPGHNKLNALEAPAANTAVASAK